MNTDRTKIYINGSWVEPLGGRVIDVINPATEQLAGQVSAATPADVGRAVKAARQAFASYSRTTGSRGSTCFRVS